MWRICFHSVEAGAYCTMGFSTEGESNVDIRSNARVLGLTGGVGSGKSTVARVLRSMGEAVYDADAAAKRLYASDERLLEAVVSRFGGHLLDEDGALDRPALAGLVFRDPNALADLNALVHPAVRRDFHQWRKARIVEGHQRMFREAAILFESKAANECDAVWGVRCPEEVRIRRLQARSGWSLQEIRDRMARQWPESEVMARCDALLVNDGTWPLVPQILRLLMDLD